MFVVAFWAVASLFVVCECGWWRYRPGLGWLRLVEETTPLLVLVLVLLLVLVLALVLIQVLALALVLVLVLVLVSILLLATTASPCSSFPATTVSPFPGDLRR